MRVEKGLTLGQLSQQTKIPASTLGSYESDDYKEIPHRNIFDLAKFHGVSADYLLGMTENRQLDNISISELHLSDAALSLLKDRKINTLLLSELITHEQFRKLMLDLEIYVDGLADMQVKSLNLAVETGRKILLKRHNPDEYNLQLNFHRNATASLWELNHHANSRNHIMLAFLLLTNPFQGASVLMIFVGAPLIIDSIQNFYSIYYISKAIRVSKSNQVINVEWYSTD